MKRSREQRDSEFTVFRVPTLVGLLIYYRKRPTKVGTLNTVKLYHRRQRINFAHNAGRVSFADGIFNHQDTAYRKAPRFAIARRHFPFTAQDDEHCAAR